jgi:ADP-ribose pyrophosphatase YjhB (NUDIX family)
MNEGRIRTIVLGIFLHAGRLLVFRGDDPARDVVFYRPLGGGIEFGERSRDAFIREMREELGAEVADIRYLGLIENIFTHLGKHGHEIVLLYAAQFVDPSFYTRESWMADDNGVPIQVLWKPLADFESGDLLVPRELLHLLKDMAGHGRSPRDESLLTLNDRPA